MEDPGPNVLEQIVKSNELLAAILAATGPAAAPAAGDPGLSGGGRCQWPTLFSWSNGLHHPFTVSGSAGYSVEVVTPESAFLSPDSAIKVVVPMTTGYWAKLQIGIPMGLSLCPRLQFAWMSKHYPTAAKITAELWYDNGVNLLKAGISADENQHKFAYLNNVGAYVELSRLDFDWNDNDWRKLDLSLNFAEAKYSYAAIDGSGYDLSAQPIYPDVTTTRKRLLLTITISNNSADNPNECYLDEILVTDGLYTGPPA